jgi:hypothetical protein
VSVRGSARTERRPADLTLGKHFCYANVLKFEANLLLVLTAARARRKGLAPPLRRVGTYLLKGKRRSRARRPCLVRQEWQHALHERKQFLRVAPLDLANLHGSGASRGVRLGAYENKRVTPAKLMRQSSGQKKKSARPRQNAVGSSINLPSSSCSSRSSRVGTPRAVIGRWSARLWR